MFRNFLTVISMLLMLNLAGQEYSLPSAEVLKAENIKSIKLHQHLLNPLQDWVKSESRSAKDTIVTTYFFGTYYLNENGRLDSLDYGFDDKFVGLRIGYDEQSRVVSYFESTVDRPNYKEITMKPYSGGWLLQTKIDGRLTKWTQLNMDSIPLLEKTLMETDSIVYKCNLETEEFWTFRYIKGELGARSYQRWVTKEGLPDSLIIEREFFSKDAIRPYPMKANGLYSGRYKVLPTGEIICPKESPFYASLEHFNFYNRLNKSSGITPYVLNGFRANSLLEESHIVDDFSFDGTTHRRYYEMVYEVR
jgi:hypothetical protein